MNLTGRKTLISCPPISDVFAYYTYIECIVRSTLREFNLDYHNPIFYRFNNKNIYQFDDTLRQTDFLMLSCYVWNWELQTALATRAKEINPSITIIGGGPHITEDDYRYFDHVIIGEAEDGLYRLFSGLTDKIVHSNRKTRSDTIYVDNKQFLLHQKQLAKDRDIQLGVIFEANRGCPFACAYCDWGSATNSKVNYFDVDKVKDEIDFVVNNLEPNFWFHADANFGITDRDIEISNYIVKCKREAGYPKTFYYSPSKNTVDRNIQIAKILWDGGVIDTYNIGIQHADKNVLIANNRGNITPSQFARTGKELIEYGIPTNTQMILGMPGDTVDKWFDSMCQIFEWGFHSETKVYWYNLLPNAPAANKHYIDKWEIETKPIIYNQSRLVTDPDDLIDKQADVIVSCKTFTKDDWVTMNIHTRWLQALHNMALLRHVAMYYRFTYGVPYAKWYKRAVSALRNHKLGIEFDSQYSTYLRTLLEADSDTYVPFYFNDEIVSVEPEDILVLHLLKDKDQFYDFIEELCDIPEIDKSGIGESDLVNYQRNLIIDINYNPDEGRSMDVNYDWVRFFDSLDQFGGLTSRPPKLNEPKTYTTNQSMIKGPTEFTSSRILWHKTSNQKRKTKLYAKAALGQIDWRGEQRMILKEWSNPQLEQMNP